MTPEEERRARFEAECEAGLWEPYWERVEDTYTEIEVLEHPWPCDFVEVLELGQEHARWIHGFRRPGCRPKLKQVQRWRRVE